MSILPGRADIGGVLRTGAVLDSVQPPSYFVVSGIFHYLGPSFAVLLFARVDVVGGAWLRIASAAGILMLWRRPWSTWRDTDPGTRRMLVFLGLVLAGEPIGVAFAFVNCAGFMAYVVLGHRIANDDAPGDLFNGIDRLTVSMVLAAAVLTPLACRARDRP
jgi:threonine/homoserine efflux transporter RhtA